MDNDRSSEKNASICSGRILCGQEDGGMRSRSYKEESPATTLDKSPYKETSSE